MKNKIYTLEEIKNEMYPILSNTDVKKVILFGSYAKNKATKNSDIDLIIDTDGKLMGFKLFSLIAKIEEKLEKNIDGFEMKEIIKNSNLDKELNSTGIVIYEK